MATAFTRTLHLLHADRPRHSTGGILIAALLLAGWLAWSASARITLYEMAATARLEVDRAAYPVQSPAAGRVVETRLAVGREVAAGDLLLRLDSSRERLLLEQKRTQWNAIGPELAALRNQFAALQQARTDERQAAATAGDEARANARGALAPARYTADDENRLRQLREGGLISEREYQKGRSDADLAKANAEREQLTIRRLDQEQRTRESDRDAQLRRLAADITHQEGQLSALAAEIDVLRNEIERCTVRAPVSGIIAEAAPLPPGAVSQPGDRLAAIVPQGKIHIVAQFPPQAALGRVRPGQRAQLRLDGFPWTQYGAVAAVVSRVAGEVRDGAVRVELAVVPNVDPARPSRIPLQHGLPGTVEIEVDRQSPAALILRHAGRMMNSVGAR